MITKPVELYYSLCLFLDLVLHSRDRARHLDLQRDRLAGKRLDEDLHSTTERKSRLGWDAARYISAAQQTTGDHSLLRLLDCV